MTIFEEREESRHARHQHARGSYPWAYEERGPSAWFCSSPEDLRGRGIVRHDFIRDLDDRWTLLLPVEMKSREPLGFIYYRDEKGLKGPHVVTLMEIAKSKISIGDYTMDGYQDGEPQTFRILSYIDVELWLKACVVAYERRYRAEAARSLMSVPNSSLAWRKLAAFPMLEEAARKVLGDDAEMLGALHLFQLYPTGRVVHPWALFFLQRADGKMRAFPDLPDPIGIELWLVEQETMEQGEDRQRQEAIWVEKLTEVKELLVQAWQGRDSVEWVAV